MKWIVGLDLRPRSSGAMHFARWLAAASRQAEAQEFIGVHVLEQEHLLAVLKFHHLDDVLAGARRAAEEAVSREGAAREISRIEVLQGLTAPESLCHFAEQAGAEGLLLGRAAPTHAGGLVRLGRIARRVLRIAPVPVVIVPPDLRGPDLEGDGPVIALAKLTDASVAVCRFAERVARRLGRRLVIAHAIEEASGATELYVAAATIENVAAHRRAEAERGLADWLRKEGLAADETQVLVGHVVDRVTEMAEQRRAALVVAGSRHGSTLERLLVASTAGELAAAATRPVAIVPPGVAP